MRHRLRRGGESWVQRNNCLKSVSSTLFKVKYLGNTQKSPGKHNSYLKKNLCYGLKNVFDDVCCFKN